MHKKNTVVTTILEYVLFFVGCMIVAISFNMLLLPNKIAMGGVMGLSIIIRDVFGFNPAYSQWFINIPIFFAGLMILGRQSAVRSAIGTFALPWFILLTESLEPVTHNPLLGALYGGLGVGLGLGLVFRSRGSVGGFSLLALILERYSPISLGNAAMVMDGFVIVWAGIAFTPENALYALVVVYIMSKTIDMVQMGFNLAKVVYVVSEAHEEITHAILNTVTRGVTRLEATGAYSGRKRPVLMVVIQQSEVSRVKTVIEQIDPFAFCVISNAHEVLGAGFSQKRPPAKKE